MEKIDYLIVGSGIAGLSFAALMAKRGKKVCLMEAHEHPGGFGHTFAMANKYKFNAQLHYVWGCGEGDTVNLILRKLDLEKDIRFERYDPDGFDDMRIPGYQIKIPGDSKELVERMSNLFPDHRKSISDFVKEVHKVSQGLDKLSSPINFGLIAKNFKKVGIALRYHNDTLQDVFDKFKLPKASQSLFASQWPDFLLPPNQLSFYAWVMLFTGYQKGAYYPSHHFEHVIDSLVGLIRSNGGEVLLNHEVKEYIVENKTVKGVVVENLVNQETRKLFGKDTICNMDPKKAAHMIGFDNFSNGLKKKLNYEYSYSNFMAYVVVKDLDLKKYGFGKWNTFHSCHDDINFAFDKMYYEQDYSKPSFAITTPSLLTKNRADCPEGWQVVEFLTVANYDYFRELKDRDEKIYRKEKMKILNSILDQVEEHYIPDFRDHMVFKMTGSPTTNEHYCWVPEGNSYGSNMTPKNIGKGRLNSHTSLNNFYFCNASSGYAGFAGTFWTGAALYSKLSGDSIYK